MAPPLDDSSEPKEVLNMAGVTRVEDLDVYRRLCELHIEVCGLARSWLTEERYELASQVRRSSNSAPANLAERHSDRHVRNQIEGINRARGETLETIHHLFIAQMKGLIAQAEYVRFGDAYRECVRMLNGLERHLEQQLPVDQRRWPEKTTEDRHPPSRHRQDCEGRDYET